MMMVDDHDEDVELLTSPVNHTLRGASGAAAVHDEEGVRKWHLGHHHDFSIESFKRHQLWENVTLIIII